MLNIPFQELAGRAQEQVLAREVRPGVDERHYVLQLIAETRRRPPTGRWRCAPKGGTPASGTRASRWPAC